MKGEAWDSQCLTLDPEFFLSHGVDANLAHCRRRVLSNARKNSLCVSSSWALSESSALKGHFIWSQKDHCDLRMLDLKGIRKITCVFLFAKLLQSCPTLCDPIDGSPPSSSIPGILQARTLEWVAISFSNAWKWKVKVKSLSRVQLSATPWTAAYQAPLSTEFSRQEHWSALPFPSPSLQVYLLFNWYLEVFSSHLSNEWLLQFLREAS